MVFLKTISFIFVSSFIVAQNGHEIALNIYTKQFPDDLTNTMNMKLVNSKNKIRNYTMKSRSIDKNRKQIIWFLEPKSDIGISFLKIEHKNRDDEMKMWLPAFKKIRRISSRKKGDSFMGSDLSYEDLSTRDMEDYLFNLKEDQNLNGKIYYTLESIPKKKLNSFYNSHVSLVDKITFNIVKEYSYDLNGKLLKEKEYTYKKIKMFDTLEYIKVFNVQKKHSTQIKFTNIEVNKNISEDSFSEQNLKRIPAN
ncbi:MAG: outer membrane lipoprotein-sorting protein [Candidatus Marinimicrobia bacterium]|jgi:hypothetical protein|nr:outer membrane lipoprotein-sorting protein [Candidatus Neomarinimicrobiota bacterium]